MQQSTEQPVQKNKRSTAERSRGQATCAGRSEDAVRPPTSAARSSADPPSRASQQKPGPQSDSIPFISTKNVKIKGGDIQKSDIVIQKSDIVLSLGQLCGRLELDYDVARYALARGMLPKGVVRAPGSGRHRSFTPAQAYFLALALKINKAGVNLPLAARMAVLARNAQQISVNLGWDHAFAPFAGKLTARKQWRLELGDGQLVRITTTANPSHRGWFAFPWMDLDEHLVTTGREQDITVLIQVDLAKIARILDGKRGLPRSAT